MKLTIAQLRAAGVSDKQILDALAEAQAQQLEKEREQSKIRSRNYRERHRVTEITRDDRDERDGSSPLSFLEVSKERKKEADRKQKPATGHRLPSDWQPKQREIEEGHRLGFTDADITRKAGEMRTWAGANANRAIARKADWDLTFLGWLRREAERKGPRKPQWRSGIEGVI
jgi:hypothetical protein